jgi:hypothetical protein
MDSAVGICSAVEQYQQQYHQQQQRQQQARCHSLQMGAAMQLGGLLPHALSGWQAQQQASRHSSWRAQQKLLAFGNMTGMPDSTTRWSGPSGRAATVRFMSA